MIITKSWKTDLLEPPVQEPVHAVQCDANTRAVAVTLTAGGVAWEPPANTAISVAFKKPDGKKGWYDKLPDGSPACSVSGNVVTAILAPEALTVAGKVDAVIVFQDKDLNQLATFGFAILVEPNPAAGRGISNDYYNYSTMEAVNQALDSFFAQAEADYGAFTQKVETEQAAFLETATQALSEMHSTVTADAPGIVCEASGEVIAVADSSDRMVQGLRIFGRTVQDGTPSPDAPVELVSVGNSGSVGLTVAGKNLANISELASGYYNDSHGTASNANSRFIRMRLSDVRPETEYTLSTNLKIYSLWYFNGGTAISRQGVSDNSVKTFTTPKNCDNIRLSLYNTSGAADTVAFEWVQLELGVAATAYEAYKAQALTVSTPNGLPGIPVSSGGNYTDESGQAWICDEVDFARGVYVRRAGAYIFTGNEAWELTANGFLQCALSTVKDLKIGAHAGVCEFSDYQYLYVGSGTFLFMTGAMSFAFAAIGSALVSSAGLTVDNVGALTSGKKVLYELKTPIETPLSAEELAAYAALHTNKPCTTVYNDSDAHMELSYVADTKLYIDNKIAAVAAAVLNNT